MTLQHTLHRIVTEKPDREAVNHLVQTSFRMALAYLHHRLRRGSLVDYQFGISNEDLAMDCIADLYQRDESGRFSVIDQYFSTMNWTQLSEEDTRIALRRLVFSKVNESLFRSYREEDPNLAKIIRNVKEAVKNDSCVSLIRYREASWLVAGPEDSDISKLPIAPPEILEAHLTSVVCGTSNTYKVVYSFVDFVAANPHYANAYPLTAFAQILRTSFQCRTVPETESEAPVFEPIEVESAIQKAIHYVRSSLHDTYVRGGKISHSLFDTYVRTVDKILNAHFAPVPDPVHSQYDALSSFMPELSKDQYMRDHRNILQYLFKLSRSRMIYYLSEEPAECSM